MSMITGQLKVSMKPLTNQEVQFEDVQSGILVLEFGTEWCGYCQAAQPIIRSVIDSYPEVTHIKIEDGKGKRLGRLFTIKLWPTLVFLNNGMEIARLVRPTDGESIKAALKQLTST